MAKVTITIEDNDNGDVGVEIESTPEFDTTGGNSPAQNMALNVLNHIRKMVAEAEANS